MLREKKMSTSYSTNIIIGYIGKDLIDSDIVMKILCITLMKIMTYISLIPVVQGDYEDGVIGFQIAWDFILDLNKVLEKK